MWDEYSGLDGGRVDVELYDIRKVYTDWTSTYCRMDLGAQLAAQDQSETLKVVKTEYSVESAGRKGTEPVVKLVTRTADRKRRVIDVHGFRPYFYIEASEFITNVEDVATERRVIGVEVPTDDVAGPVKNGMESACDAYDHIVPMPEDNRRQTLHDGALVRVYTREPEHVGTIRDHFDTTYEADVPFTERFKVDVGIDLGVEVPANTDEVRYENWNGGDHANRTQEISSVAPPEVEPHLLALDIEVATEGKGFPEPHRAKQPVTAITAYDNYTDDYVAWILESPEWDFNESTSEVGDAFETETNERIGLDTEIEVFTNESNLLEAFNTWVKDRGFDLYTGWNSDDFDYPYLIKRSLNLGAYTVLDWTPVDINDKQEIAVWAQNDSVNMKMQGMVPFDMLTGYKKTIWKKLKSYGLDDVSKHELGVEKAKLDVDGEDLDAAWHDYPFSFVAYNVRDTEAVVEIEAEKDVIDLYENMMSVTGSSYRGCHLNGIMLDSLFLNQAREEGVALPTNVEPEQGNFHGAHVFPPEPGRHETVVYPDLASLYPYIIWTLNISPDTFYNSENELRADGYTTDDAFVTYVDKRDFKTVPSDKTVGDVDEEQYKGVVDEHGDLRNPPGMLDPSPNGEWEHVEPIYFLKPDVKEGFVRKMVDDLVDMKYEYKGTDMYAAVKRVTNCFTSDTDVMTPDGVRNIRDLEIGDDVYSIDPDTGTVELKPVVETYAYPDYDDEIIDMNTSKIDFGVTPNHRMLVSSDDADSEYEFIEAGEMNEYTEYQFPSEWDVDHGDSVETVRLTDYCDPSEYEVRVDPLDHGRTFRSECPCEPMKRDSNTATYIFDGETYSEYSDEIDALASSVELHAGENYKWVPNEYDADDFIEFLGWYVTEGSIYTSAEAMFDGQYRGSSTCITLTKYKESDGRDRINECLSRMGIKPSVNDTDFAIASKSLATVVESFCGSGSREKELPDWIFDVSEQQKRLLFETLIRGDGDSSDDSYRYSTASESLRDDVSRLCVELGKTPQYTYDGDVWRIHYASTNNSIRMHRSSTTTTADDGVYCVEVADNNTLMAGRNGNFQFVGNSLFGVLGDSESAGRGFRLFQWELAEAITLTGRRVIQYTSDQYGRLINSYKEDAGAYLVAGDTDSVQSAIPGADNYLEALELAQRASEQFDTNEDGSPGLYDEFMEDEFGVIHGEDEHKMDVEIESVATACFFVEDMDSPGEAKKKRYAQDIIWEDSVARNHPRRDELHGTWVDTTPVDLGYEVEEEDGWQWIPALGHAYDPEPTEERIDIKGFEYVRSDTATVTQEVQYEVLLAVVTEDDPTESLSTIISDAYDRVTGGNVPLAELGQTKGIGNPLEEYGRSNEEPFEVVSRAGPTYRGAKYTHTHFPWENIQPGSKPMRFYVEKVRSDEYPEVYTYDGQFPDDAHEIDDPVDAITVTKPELIPDDFDIDYERMSEKVLRKPIEPIAATMDVEWDHVIGEGRQSGLDAFC